MSRLFALFLPVWLTAANAATTSTTLTVQATVALASTNVVATGTASLSGVGSGTISSTVPLATVLASTEPNAAFPFTITLPTGTLTGTLSIPAALLVGSATSGTGSATVTGGTGAFSGDTGQFPSLAGTASGSLTAGFTVNFTGAGTLTTSGGGGSTNPPPVITAVLDAGSYTAGIVEGSIFVVKGTNLSGSGLTSFSFPLPTSSSSGGVSITFTPAAGGTGTNAYLVYTYNENGVNQLAAILPSTLPPGNYNVTVTNGGATSAAVAATVLAHKPELFTQDSSGTGLAVVQNYISASELDIDRLTTGTLPGGTFSPAKPGQVVIAWGTGLGPVSFPDNTGSPGYDFTKNGVNVQALVGGVAIAPAYAGRTATLAGEDEIVFTLPANVPTGCAVPLQVSVNGILSTTTYIAIAPSAGASACVAPGFTTTQLQNFDNGGSFTAGAFEIFQLQETVSTLGLLKEDSAGGSFTRVSGFQLASAPTLAFTPSGACQVTTISEQTSQSQTPVSTAANVTDLDAGTVTLTGPSGSGLTNAALPENPTSFLYQLSLGAEGISVPNALNAMLVPGTYILNGAGGKDVGKFTASLTLGSPLAVTGGLPTSISRASALTLNWTGGNASDLVEIVGYSSTVTATSYNATEFICTTTAGARTFTVPASVMAQLPPATGTTVGGTTSSGELEMFSAPQPSPFTAPLTAGGNIDFGYFLAFLGNAVSVTYQ